MMDLLEPRADDDALSRSFRDAKPFRHLVIDNLLTSEFCRELADTFPGFRADKAISELGTVGGRDGGRFRGRRFGAIGLPTYIILEPNTLRQTPPGPTAKG